MTPTAGQNSVIQESLTQPSKVIKQNDMGNNK